MNEKHLQYLESLGFRLVMKKDFPDRTEVSNDAWYPVALITNGHPNYERPVLVYANVLEDGEDSPHWYLYIHYEAMSATFMASTSPAKFDSERHVATTHGIPKGFLCAEATPDAWHHFLDRWFCSLLYLTEMSGYEIDPPELTTEGRIQPESIEDSFLNICVERQFSSVSPRDEW